MAIVNLLWQADILMILLCPRNEGVLHSFLRQDGLRYHAHFPIFCIHTFDGLVTEDAGFQRIILHHGK